MLSSFAATDAADTVLMRLVLLSSWTWFRTHHGPNRTGRGGRTAAIKFYELRDNLWPVYENSNMDGTLTGAAADYLVLSGDFQQFAIVDRIGTSVELVPHIMGANRRPIGARGFYMHWRTGSGVLVSDAFRLSNFST